MYMIKYSLNNDYKIQTKLHLHIYYRLISFLNYKFIFEVMSQVYSNVNTMYEFVHINIQNIPKERTIRVVLHHKRNSRKLPTVFDIKHPIWRACWHRRWIRPRARVDFSNICPIQSTNIVAWSCDLPRLLLFSERLLPD